MVKPTRSQQLGALIHDAVLRSRLDWSEYADAVVTLYHASVDVTDRRISFHVATCAAQYDKAARLNTQTVKRVLIGEQIMQADLEESLIEALPAEARDRVLTQMLARQGLLLARRPDGTTAGTIQAPCDLMRKAAKAIERIAPVLGGEPSSADDNAAALIALQDVMGCCVALTAQISAGQAHPHGARRADLKAVGS